ncbi:MAG: amino acid/polyamine/organocation transporter, superfamily [Bacteroidetes bacterium]|nr:amino acid/polyamine/organocation transporter, superfamily [Bacteroidota bacterium]
MIKSLFIRKSLAQIETQAEESSLRKHLNLTNIILLGIGCIIGAGIFVLTGTAAALHAGPAIAISFIVSAFGCLLAGLCYAEFASMIPVSGSAYTYGYATMGEFIAWIIGWDLILEYLFGSATVAVGWSGYVTSFLSDIGLQLPASICQSPFIVDASGWHATGALINFPAVFIVALMTTLLVVGIKESASFNNIIVLIKVTVILLFIGFGIAHINVDNWTPFIPANTGSFSQFGWTGILTGAAVVFFAYIGFDAVSTTAQEAINPKRDIPIGILGSLVVCTILYVAVSLVMTGIVNYKDLNVSAPIAVAIDAAGKSLRWLSPIIKIGAIAGLSSVVMVLLLAQSRIFYTMASDGLLWKSFAKTHPKFKTPYITSIVTGCFAALFAGLFPIGLLGELVSIGTLLAFVIVSVGLIILRKTEPDAHRAFRTPFVPLVPILGALVCLVQMASLPLDTWIRLLGWMAIGFIIYFTYGIKHSRVRKEKQNNQSV